MIFGQRGFISVNRSTLRSDLSFADAFAGSAYSGDKAKISCLFVYSRIWERNKCSEKLELKSVSQFSRVKTEWLGRT